MTPMPLPSGPSSSVEKQSFAWFSRPHAFLLECAATLGDCFTLSVHGWGSPIVVVSHPDAIREVFTAHQDVLLGGKGNAFIRPLFREGSLFVLDGERHHRQRHLLMPAFHGQALRRYSRVIFDTATVLCRTWPLEQPFSIQEKMLELALEIILLAIFGIREDEVRYQPVKRQLQILVHAVSTSVALASAEADAAAERFAQIRGALDALLAEELSHRRQWPDPTRGDVLSLLMEARDEHGQPMSDDELRDELVTLLTAGHDTTATSVAWALLALAENPAARARLLEEIDALGPSPDPDVLAHQPYLAATVNEALRVHPVVTAVSRLVAKPFRVAGYDLEPGTIVAPAIFLAHRRPQAFPEPERFRPERFLERDPSPFEYLPFGGGARRCIGMGLALHQMKIVLGVVLSRLQLESALRHPLREVRHGVLVAPSEGARMIARSRKPPSGNEPDEERACGMRS